MKAEPETALGRLIRAARLDMRPIMTQADLAVAAGKSLRTIATYERQTLTRPQVPDWEVMAAIRTQLRQTSKTKDKEWRDAYFELVEARSGVKAS